MKKILFFITIMLLGCTKDTKDDLIYGQDNRRDYYQISNPKILKNMDSSFIIVDPSQIEKRGGFYLLKPAIFGEAYRLCKNEPYYWQPSVGYCSGFSVGGRTVVSAGHCAETAVGSYCVFGYRAANPNEYYVAFPDSLVFKITSIKKSAMLSDGTDFMVAEVDSLIPPNRNVTVRDTRPKRLGRVYCVGYPCGLPEKMTSGAYIRASYGSFFAANLDTYGGNSGSPVFSQDDHRAIGILVRGDEDFVRRGNCYASKRCQNESCRGEDVVWLDIISKWF